MKLDSTLPLPADLLARMDATPQNPRYHREGSVLAHTKYVLQQFLSLRESFGLSPEEEQILYWAAILQDIGKTVTTVWMDGRHRSPGHERAGLPFAQEILLQQADVSAESRRRILDLVRWHGLPLRLVNAPMDEVKRLGTRTDLKLLGIFALCDFLGRDCDDKPYVTEVMQAFHTIRVPQVEFELGKFTDLHASSQTWNLRHKNAVWNACRFNQTSLLEKLVLAQPKDNIETRGQRTTVVFGPPLAGKTAWIKENYPDHFHVSLHEHDMSNALRGNEYLIARKLIEFKHLMRVYLNRHKHVILESRDLDEDIRLRLGEALRDMPVELDYVVLESSLTELKARNATAAVPMDEALLEQIYHEMDLFHPWEAHRIQYIRG
jgi:predicted kinase